jgi:hypothetical protein
VAHLIPDFNIWSQAALLHFLGWTNIKVLMAPGRQMPTRPKTCGGPDSVPGFLTLTDRRITELSRSVLFTFEMTCACSGWSVRCRSGLQFGDRGTADRPHCRWPLVFHKHPSAQKLSINCTSISREHLNKVRVRGCGE